MHADKPAAFGFGLVNIGSEFNQLAANHNAKDHAGGNVSSDSDDPPNDPLGNDHTSNTPAPIDSNPSDQRWASYINSSCSIAYC